MAGIAQTHFLGATAASFSSSVGWNEQASSCTVRLVEDPIAGDRFNPPPVGTPVAFAMGGFRFEGLLESHRQFRDMQGSPVYEARLVDPREVLASAQVLLAGYPWPTDQVPNLLNAYGYWEHALGFGGGMANESGMLWDAPFEILELSTAGHTGGLTITRADRVGVVPALRAMMEQAGPYGGPLQYRGHAYMLDLSGLPPAPPYYRVGGDAQTLLSLIATLCDDAGCDFLVTLDGSTIRVRTVSRASQPRIGTIAAWAMGRQDAASKSAGVELRGGVTNAVLVGGDVCSLQAVTNPSGGETIWPWWGVDADGLVVVGRGDPESTNHAMALDATPIADVMGGFSYPCSVDELRCALMDYESWAYYVMKNSAAEAEATGIDKAEVIGLANTVDAESDLADLFPEAVFRRDLLGQDVDSAVALGDMNGSDYWTARANRVYEFVRGYATECYGKRFLVRLPFFVYWKQVPETTLVVSSDEVSQDGGYAPEGEAPLGLAYADADLFMTDDGRLDAYVAFPYEPSMDLRSLDPDSYAIEGRTLYLAATVEPTIRYMPDSPYPTVVVTLASPLYDAAADPLGGLADIAATMGLDEGAIREGGAGLRHGSWPVRVHPPAYRPTGAAIPMRSKAASYGPWWVGGPAGRVDYKRDQELTPWNYGDWATMNAAAMAQIAAIPTEQQEAEVATVVQAGLPTISLGDALVAGGPEMTDIACEVGAQGITTTYQAQTFTPKFGAFSRTNADRLKRLGKANYEVRRALRALYRKQSRRAAIAQAATAGFLENAARAVRQATPHDVILGSMTETEKHGWRTQVSTMTCDEFLANIRADDQSTYQSMAGMGLEGLFRPFTAAYRLPADATPAAPATDSGIPADAAPGDAYNPSDPQDAPIGAQGRGVTPGEVPPLGATQPGAPQDDGTDSPLPHFEKCRPDLLRKAWTTQELDPVRDSDVDLVVNGQYFNGAIHRLKGRIDYSQARMVGHRGPMVVVGYGPEYTGKPMPNAGDETLTVDQWQDDFRDGYQHKPEAWRAGVVALHYDTWRGVWTIPTIVRGTLDAPLPTDGSASAKMTRKVFGSDKDSNSHPYGKVQVYCDLGGPSLPAGTRVVASYEPLENRWYVTSASCG